MSRVASAVLVMIVLLASAAVRPAAAQERDALLVGPAWLSARLTSPSVVVLHIGNAATYERGHIPGARLVGLYDLSMRTNGPLRLEMLPAEELQAKLQQLGIGDDTTIVLYADVAASLTAMTRLVFTFDRAGLGARTKVLDGGLEAWTGAGHAVTTEVPAAPAAARLSPLTIRPIVVDGDTVRARLRSSGFAIVDGRATGFYDGSQTGGSMDEPHKTGHIAGAGSVPFSSVADGLRWKSAGELRSLFTQAGVEPGDTVIAYCHIGQQATAAIFAARLLGHPVLLYDGSFEDWSRRADAPVETTIKKN